MNLKKSQSIIDFAIAFIAVAVLIVGIIRIWVWFNANYAKRQQAYQASRITAAKPATDYTTPVDIGAEPLDLTEDWVFKGLPSGTVSGIPLETIPGGPTVPSDNPCASVGTIIGLYNEQIKSICGPDNDCNRCVYAECDTTGCGQACSLRKNAQSMRDTAAGCDDPWEICWWGDWGKTPGELRRAANKLDETATGLETSANALANKSQQLQDCCSKETVELQTECLNQVR